MPNMPATGVSGIDLYVRDGAGQWRWRGNRPAREFPTNEVVFDGPREKR